MLVHHSSWLLWIVVLEDWSCLPCLLVRSAKDLLVLRENLPGFGNEPNRIFQLKTKSVGWFFAGPFQFLFIPPGLGEACGQWQGDRTREVERTLGVASVPGSTTQT